MSRLTRQERMAVWVLLLLLAGGAAGRWWIRHGAMDGRVMGGEGTNAVRSTP